MAKPKSDDAVAKIDPAELAELVAAAEKRNDLTVTGRAATSVDTNTQIEDRTDAPALASAVEYKVTTVEFDNGTVLTNYGDAKDA